MFGIFWSILAAESFDFDDCNYHVFTPVIESMKRVKISSEHLIAIFAVKFNSTLGILRLENLRLVRFALSGVAATILYFVLITIILLISSIRADIASVIAYFLSIAFSYVLQSRFTFQLRNDNLHQIGAFVAVSLMGLAISYFMMVILHLWYGFSAFSVAAIVCFVIPAVNYILFKRIVFVRRDPASHDVPSK